MHPGSGVQVGHRFGLRLLRLVQVPIREPIGPPSALRQVVPRRGRGERSEEIVLSRQPLSEPSLPHLPGKPLEAEVPFADASAVTDHGYCSLNPCCWLVLQRTFVVERASALVVDYVLMVGVSVAAGVANIVSAVPSPWRHMP